MDTLNLESWEEFILGGGGVVDDAGTNVRSKSFAQVTLQR